MATHISPAELHAALEQALARIAELEALIATERQSSTTLRPEGASQHKPLPTAAPATTEHEQAAVLMTAQRDLARLIAQDAPEAEVWTTCLQAAILVSGLDCGGLYLFNADNRAFELVAHQGLSPAFVQAVAHFAEDTPNAQLMLRGTGVCFTAAEMASQNDQRAEGLRAMAAIPLEHRGQVLGCLNVASHLHCAIPEQAYQALAIIAVEIGSLLIQQQSEAALKQSHAQLSAALVAARMGTLRYHLPTQRIFWSPEAAQIIGTNQVEETLSRFIEYFHPEDRELALNVLQEALAQKSVPSREYRIFTASGELRWITNYGKLEYDQAGNPLALSGLIQDITERKQAEQKLQRNEQLLRLFVAHTPAAIAMFDRDMRYIIASQRYLIDYRLGELDVTGRSHYDVFPEMTDEHRAIHQRCLAGDVEIQANDRLLRADGTIDWVRYEIRPWYELNDEIGGLIFLSEVITERKTAEAALRASEERYRHLAEELEQRVQQRTAEVQDLYDHAPVGYHSLDAEGRIVMINQTELDWLGYSREELLGRSMTDLFTPETLEVFTHEFPVFKQRGWMQNAEVTLIRKDGSTFPTLINATAIKDATGQFLMSRSVVFDNTERKKAEVALRLSRDQLSVANAALHKASQAKNEFLATMSHELRTPLNGILGMAEILLEEIRGPLNERQRRAVANIESSGGHLLSLINDILDLSKVEAGKLELHLESILVGEICETSLIFMKEPALKKDLNLAYEFDPQVVTMTADGRRLKQILINLLSNAVKFTPSGGKVTLQVRGDAERQTIDFAVIDTGIGIAAADMKRLFKPFTQVDSSLARAHEGSGLGLALVMDLVELHGGSIKVVSEVGQGSTFTVRLPWDDDLTGGGGKTEPHQSEAAPSRQASAQPPPCSGTILLVEDKAISIVAMSDYLSNLGYSIITATNGQEAIERAQAHTPDLILMDIHMPVMDGLQSIRRLRADPRFATVPIIALTALAMTGDRERCLAAGATDYLSKPVKMRQLAALIARLLTPTG
ncbi:PAS domain S-box protein [Candidatus Chloroploca asiatica]|uniref:PAS domain S-box protein n=1 Tax=Candidatus Chloroploca asiatica TaxID=1506545 RepID=UPI000BE9D56C|nr:PAS domain S-box protein [Candidatus Chloroploca asiatica]